MEILLTAPLKRIKKIETFGEAEPVENRRSIFHTAIFLGRPSSPLKRLSEHWRNGIRIGNATTDTAYVGYKYLLRRGQSGGEKFAYSDLVSALMRPIAATETRYSCFTRWRTRGLRPGCSLPPLNLEFYGRPLLLIR